MNRVRIFSTFHFEMDSIQNYYIMSWLEAITLSYWNMKCAIEAEYNMNFVEDIKTYSFKTQYIIHKILYWLSPNMKWKFFNCFNSFNNNGFHRLLWNSRARRIQISCTLSCQSSRLPIIPISTDIPIPLKLTIQQTDISKLIYSRRGLSEFNYSPFTRFDPVKHLNLNSGICATFALNHIVLLPFCINIVCLAFDSWLFFISTLRVRRWKPSAERWPGKIECRFSIRVSLNVDHFTCVPIGSIHTCIPWCKNPLKSSTKAPRNIFF